MDSIAIIGFACRFPGDARSAGEFWELICKAKTTHSRIARFNASAFHADGKDRLNLSRTQEAHFLQQDIATFDANFFSIHNAEAVALDPQQRIMLEVAYEAFENAGLPLGVIAGSDTSCYVGCSTADYREMTFRDIDHTAGTYSMGGTGTEMISNRISWFYDLKGPSYTLATACSSSLVAFHQGCQSIRTGEASTALVGGCNLLLNPEMFQVLSNGTFLADDGICKAFDTTGNGYGRGEGFAAIILKSVSDAIRDGDPIRAVVRGTGVNHDGKTKGVSLPSADAQADLIRSVYKRAGLDFSGTHYVEAHGTGTKAGDPLELEGISKTISSAREDDHALIVGSVKSNIGHLESAAGLAGVIKAIYILERAIIPPNVHFENPNKGIPFKKWKIRVPTQVLPWPGQGQRRISVQGFGYGGTNAHAILDDAYHFLKENSRVGIHFTAISPMTGHRSTNTGPKTQKSSDDIQRDRLFVITSQNQVGLSRQRASIVDYLQGRTHVHNDHALLRDLAFTLSEKRSFLLWRTYEVASSVKELISHLQEEASGKAAVRCLLNPRIGFVFTGQGSQWARMGVDLLQYKVFRESMEQADLYIRDQLKSGWSLLEEFCRDEADSKVDMPSYSQPMCTALQIALVDLLESWNIIPSAIVGHSSGEIAGAYCLGALSKEDALLAAFYRGSLSENIRSRAPGLEGGMIAIGTSKSKIEPWVEKFTGVNLGIACVNSPASVTLSGDIQAIEDLEQMLNRTNVFARRLKVAIAYHSSHMDVIAEAYMDSMSDLKAMPAKEGRSLYSSVTGKMADWSELGALSWVRNLVSPVLFYDALLELVRPTISDGQRVEQNTVDLLVEIGPHATLRSAVKETQDAHNIKDVRYVSILSRKCNGIRTALETAGTLLAEGVRVRMFEVNDYAGEASYGQPQPLVDLPAYSWDHSKRYWAESRLCKQHNNRQHPPTSLLGAPFPALSEKGRIWRGITRLNEEPWIKDHAIESSIIFPAAGFLVMVIEAACQVAEQGRVVRSFKLRDIQFAAPASMSEDFGTEFVLQFSPHQTGTRDTSATFTHFVICTSSKGQDLRQNCSGLVLTEYQYAERSEIALEHALEDLDCRDKYRDTLRACHQAEKPYAFYQSLAAAGLIYGPAFQGLSDIRSGEGFSCCTVTVPDVGLSDGDDTDRPHIIHPTTLDAMFHAAFAAFRQPKGQLSSAMVPKSIDEVIVNASIDFSATTQFKGYAQTSRQGFREIISNVVMLDSYLLGSVVSVRRLCCVALSANTETSTEERGVSDKRIFSKALWKPFSVRTHHDSGISVTKSTQNLDECNHSPPSDRSNLTSDQVIEESDEPLLASHTDFIVLESRHSSRHCQILCTKLIHELESSHMSVGRRKWGSDITDLAGKHCVSTVDLDEYILFDTAPDDFNAIKDLILECASLMWISNATEPAGHLSAGMMRSIRNEIPATSLRNLKICADALQHPDRTATLIGELLLRSTVESEFVEKDGVLKVCRFVEDQSMNDYMAPWMTRREKSVKMHSLKAAQRPLKLAIGTQGMFDTLYLDIDKEAASPLKNDEVEIKVWATGVNFRDVMVAMGQIPDSSLGFEASGTILRTGSEVTGFVPGDKVCALGQGAHRAVFRTKGKFCIRIPPNVLCEEAATIPLVHATAYYALIHIARVRRGQSILIHAAAGGVGQAALQLANHIGLEVFATVGSKNKRTLVHQQYNIPHDHIFNSRDLSFAKGVMRMTNSRGVDCILNSLSGEALRQTWHCIAPFGSFIEIGLKDILSNTGLDMQPFLQNATFMSVNLKHLMTDNPDLLAEVLREVFSFHSRGILKPVRPIKIYPLSNMEHAFRLMQVGKHVGKVALSWGVDHVVPQLRTYQPGPPASLDPNASYLLVGGLGGLGRSLAGLLVSLGARHLCFMSRSGARSSDAKALLRTMASLHVNVSVHQCDIAEFSDIRAAFDEHSLSHPPIKGAFQCAMALHDSLFEKMTHHQWSSSLRPKVLGTYNLHMLLPKDLDFFVILSSFAGIFGNRAQSNYAAANTYQDALAEQRHKLGLKAVTINLGIIREIGVLAEQGGTGYLKEWEIPLGIREREFHSLIRMVIAGEMSGQKSEVPTQIITGLPTGGAAYNAGIERPFFFDDPRFSELASAGLGSEHLDSPDRANSSRTAVSLQSLIMEADSIGTASNAMTEAIVARLAKSLQIPTSEIDAGKSLHSYGVDSLLAIEMVRWVFKEAKVMLSVLDILATQPIAELGRSIISKAKTSLG